MSYFDGHIRELGPVPEELLAPLDRLLENSRDTFLKVMHGGCNKSAIDRIHLIFDYYDAA